MSNQKVIAVAGAYCNTVETLERAISGCGAEWIAFAPTDVGQRYASVVEAHVASGRLASNTGLLMAEMGTPSTATNSVSRYPALLATLIQGPRAGLIPVVRANSLSGELQIRNVADPLWDWFVRAAKSGCVLIDASCDAVFEGVPGEEFLGELAPSDPPRNREWLAEHLRAIKPQELVSTVQSEVDAVALKAGVLQLHDFLDASHELSQSIEGEGVNRSGDYWHAIMHRREPDYGNSKYWFRRVGPHPVIQKLAKLASRILANGKSKSASEWSSRLVRGDRWDPFAFVDLCESVARSNDPELDGLARQMQGLEMRLLLSQSYADASGQKCGD